MPKRDKIDWKATERLVRERLEFVDLITGLNSRFLDPSLARDTPEGGWTHPWFYFDSLRNYLLLTCFDLLGQPSSYRDFQSWLIAKDAESERAAVVAKVPANATALEAAGIIHREYNQIYGTTVSFYRFINAVIPSERRESLLYSLRIRRIDPVANLELEVIEDADQKMKWLFTVRNSFTHKAINTGSPGGGVFKNCGAPIEIEGRLRQGWMPIQWQEKGGTRFEYSVRNWPAVLQDTVLSGLERREEMRFMYRPQTSDK